jgi:uncharacterized LabA/DUF88 family protein
MHTNIILNVACVNEMVARNSEPRVASVVCFRGNKKLIPAVTKVSDRHTHTHTHVYICRIISIQKQFYPDKFLCT